MAGGFHLKSAPKLSNQWGPLLDDIDNPSEHYLNHCNICHCGENWTSLCHNISVGSIFGSNPKVTFAYMRL